MGITEEEFYDQFEDSSKEEVLNIAFVDNLSLFSFVFTDILFEDIARETNIYFHMSGVTKRYIIKQWEDITGDHIRAFVGILILWV
jgi:hypothetical protein